MIRATVGLPMYRSKNIAELSLESLCAQKNIDFEWELLIIEEEEDSLGKENISSFSKRLSDVGCTKIEYFSIKGWIPLSMKWYHLSQNASNTSECFLLKAADCYSQPYRLKETYDIFSKNEGIDWVQAKKGYFYDIASESVSRFNHDLCFTMTAGGRRSHPCALNMAIRTNLLKRIPPTKVRRGVDGHIYSELQLIKGEPLNVGWLESDNWKLGLDTHGLNNISRLRGRMIVKNKPPFEETTATISDIVPSQIQDFLNKLRVDALEHKYKI